MSFLRSHVLLLILLFAGAMTFLWLLQFRKRLHMTWYAALILALVHVMYGVFCVRIFARFEGASVGSMSIFGAVFFMPIGYYLGAKLFKRPVAEVFDIFTVPMVFTLLCSRVNCLIAGCCIGTHIGNTNLLYPTREAEMLFYVIFLSIVAPRVWKGLMNGKLYPIYMVSYGVFRGICEFFRYSATATGILHLSHLWAVISLTLGIAIYFAMQHREKRMLE